MVLAAVIEELQEQARDEKRDNLAQMARQRFG
jgi:hypothetical protein